MTTLNPRVRSRRSVIWGTGPLPDLLRTRLGPASTATHPGTVQPGSDAPSSSPLADTTPIPARAGPAYRGAVAGDADSVRSNLALADLVIVLDPGVFAPVPPGRALTRRTQLLSDLGLFLDSFAEEIGHVIIVTSAAVLGAEPEQDPHTDHAPMVGATDGSVADLAEAEREIISRLSAQIDGGPEVGVLRAAALVGPGVDSMITRHFEAPRLLTIKGYAGAWQFIHIEDVVTAVELMLARRVVGPCTAGASGSLGAQEVVEMSGLREIPLAAATAFSVAERLHRVGVLPAPASDLAYSIYPWTVTSERLREMGWQAQFSNEECLRVLLDEVRGKVGVAGRRMGGVDAAALGAAGAAVAVIGTAAIWRQVRGR